jgi:hypothetical protein
MCLFAAGSTALTAGLTGCAGTYDLITSQRFRERPFATMFSSDDPMWVLENVADGDERARAMRRLKEPKNNGGTAEQQEKAIDILGTCATSDRRPMLRLAAISALTRFEDPRAGQILVSAYTNAPLEVPGTAKEPVTQAGGMNLRGGQSGFTPDTVVSIQCLVMDSLGKTKSAEGLRLLCEVASVTGRPGKAATIEQAGGNRGQMNPDTGLTVDDRVDVRLAAIRSLGSYEKEPTAIKVLVEILQTEKDVALRGRAHESLTKITGQDLPEDGAAWADWMTKGMPQNKGLLGGLIP